MDALALARIQFAANISFHILFPSITIALGWILLYFKLRARGGDPKWMQAYGFWVKVFALSFALGVVSGITMSFQFGTNWPGYMQRVGNIAGPLLGYEVLTAFFLEATFLGIMLFGRRRVSERVHTLATFLVACGTDPSSDDGGASTTSATSVGTGSATDASVDPSHPGTTSATSGDPSGPSTIDTGVAESGESTGGPPVIGGCDGNRFAFGVFSDNYSGQEGGLARVRLAIAHANA